MREHLQILSRERRRRFTPDGGVIHEETLDDVARRLLREAEQGRVAVARMGTAFARGVVSGAGFVLAAGLVAALIWTSLQMGRRVRRPAFAPPMPPGFEGEVRHIEAVYGGRPGSVIGSGDVHAPIVEPERPTHQGHPVCPAAGEG